MSQGKKESGNRCRNALPFQASRRLRAVPRHRALIDAQPSRLKLHATSRLRPPPHPPPITRRASRFRPQAPGRCYARHWIASRRRGQSARPIARSRHRGHSTSMVYGPTCRDPCPRLLTPGRAPVNAPMGRRFPLTPGACRNTPRPSGRAHRAPPGRHHGLTCPAGRRDAEETRVHAHDCQTLGQQRTIAQYPNR